MVVKCYEDNLDDGGERSRSTEWGCGTEWDPKIAKTSAQAAATLEWEWRGERETRASVL
jgi:hypothetical protein